MQQKHLQLLREIEASYGQIEQSTHTKYREFMQRWQDHAKAKIDRYKETLDSLREERDRLREVSEFNIKVRPKQNLTDKVKAQSEEKRQLLEQLNSATSESAKYQETVVTDYQTQLIVLAQEKTEAEHKVHTQNAEIVALLLKDLVSQVEFEDLNAHVHLLSAEIGKVKEVQQPSLRQVKSIQKYAELLEAFNAAKARKAKVQKKLEKHPDSKEHLTELAKVSNELERLVYAMDVVRQEAAAAGIALETGPLRANTILEKKDDALVRRLERELELAHSELKRLEGLVLARPFISNSEDFDRLVAERNEAQAQLAELRTKMLAGADVPAIVAEQVANNEAEKLKLREELSRCKAEYEIKLASIKTDNDSHREELKKLKSRVMAPGANIEQIKGHVNESAAWSAVLAERDAAKAEAEALKSKINQTDSLAEFYHTQLKDLEASSRAAQSEAFARASKAEANSEKLQTDNESLKEELKQMREAMLQGADAAQASVKAI